MALALDVVLGVEQEGKDKSVSFRRFVVMRRKGVHSSRQVTSRTSWFKNRIPYAPQLLIRRETCWESVRDLFV